MGLPCGGFVFAVYYKPGCVQAWAEGLKLALYRGFAFSPSPRYPRCCNDSPHKVADFLLPFMSCSKPPTAHFKFLVSSAKCIFKDKIQMVVGLGTRYVNAERKGVKKEKIR